MSQGKYKSSYFIFFNLFWYTTRVFFMSFVLSTLHMNKLSNYTVSTSKQLSADKLLSLITRNAKTYAYELKIGFKKQIWMNIMLFDPVLKEQAQEVIFSRKNYFIQNLLLQYIFLWIYLNEKLDFCYHIFVINIKINARNRYL